MLTREEVLEKLYNSKEIFTKPLVRLGILKLTNWEQSVLDPREVWTRFKFNFYNPLTYIYLIPAIIICIPIGLLNNSLKELWRNAKKELTKGIELFLN
jgi:hypothetical protein